MSSVPLSARRDVRRHARTLIRRRDDVGVHLARIHASLQLDGIEPVQGALADLFGSLGKDHAALKAAALQLAAPRLGSRLARRFQVWVGAQALPRITPLATRWSLLVSASADTPTRSRRCSADDSRRLAAQFVTAFQAQEANAQAHFLHHCLTCQDRLAFMIARREILKRQDHLPDGWADVQNELQGEGILV
ncbi:MAG: hypothetical protein M3R45_08705 [Pseudomonadota bacterium]|nr:hypothetical protein [Pseudomonadota bacterium]